MRDVVQRFHFQDSPVRGQRVQLSETVQAVLSRHDYPPRVEALLSEALAAAALLASTLKFEGTLILQARGDGPLETLMVECNHRLELRGIAQLSDGWTEADAGLPFGELFGRGQLSITIDPDAGQRYQGIVPLDADSLAGCLEHYFEQSEQLPTRIWLAASGSSAGGLLLQVLPGHDQGDDADLWPRLCELTHTVQADELLNLGGIELLYRLYHEETLVVQDGVPAVFRCSCSRERTSQVLLSLGAAELRDIVAEQNGVFINCQFCNAHYAFDEIDIEQLLRGGDVSSSQLH